MTQTDLRSRFIEGMARAATFVSVVTTDGAAGRAGVTVSSMTSVAADGAGPSLLFCVHHKSAAAPVLMANRAFCANLLHENQQDLADLFSSRSRAEGAGRFDHAAWVTGQGGQPVLAGATASFECVIATALLWDTHYIIVGKVTEVRLSDDPAALLYGQRAYRRAVSLGSDSV
jgi:flavin reductase (DIM6/NTAB) family NADH-FMN oxidoreductase RutF